MSNYILSQIVGFGSVHPVWFCVLAVAVPCLVGGGLFVAYEWLFPMPTFSISNPASTRIQRRVEGEGVKPSVPNGGVSGVSFTKPAAKRGEWATRHREQPKGAA